ncbi:MAG TPA: HlyD family type I secretion periplasmic adaptor subunit [Candidatus Cybelea sp.]|nr:HlyD family type I secretion periplasmic adaptor subunit [Candidatus Cybelea sp.]
MTQMIPSWQAALEAESRAPSLRRIVRQAFLVIGLGFGSFLVWACLAPLDSAVPAMGNVVVETKRKTVSLLDPGILKQLYVKEGDRVEKGQPLLKLDEAQAMSQLGSLKAQYWTTVAKVARLRAEQDEQASIEFPKELRDAAAADSAIAGLVANEQHVFEDRYKLYDSTIGAQERKVKQAQEQIAAMKAQLASMQQRLALTEQELQGTNELLAKGYATKTRMYEIKRNEAELRGNIGELTAHQAETQQAIAQTELEIASTRNQRRQDISKDLQDAQGAAADLSERVRGAQDLLTKRDVLAPESGKVTDIKFFTPGSAIGAGQPILDIVPQSDTMIVEANVRPDDIEHLRPGQRVNIRLTAYKQHKVPVLTGHLTYVSADLQQDPKGESFYLARAEIDRDALTRIQGVSLYPGMPAEMLIIGGERKAIDYFLSPITDSLNRSMREE